MLLHACARVLKAFSSARNPSNVATQTASTAWSADDSEVNMRPGIHPLLASKVNNDMNRNLPLPYARLSLAACALVAAMTFATAIADAEPAQASVVAPPAVPTNLQVPEGNVLFRVGHAGGTQNYVCLPSDGGPKFVLFTPQAVLIDDANRQLATHYFSPNPFEAGTIRVTWQDSLDSSRVWGQAVQSSTDRDFVARDSIPWLLIERVGALAGPDGEGGLAETTFVQRLNTSGGVAPQENCQTDADVGAQAFVPYSADYFFYRGQP
jgi:hypothetical protein